MFSGILKWCHCRNLPHTCQRNESSTNNHIRSRKRLKIRHLFLASVQSRRKESLNVYNNCIFRMLEDLPSRLNYSQDRLNNELKNWFRHHKALRKLLRLIYLNHHRTTHAQIQEPDTNWCPQSIRATGIVVSNLQKGRSLSKTNNKK
jgi:hypothetical protein